MAAEFSDIFSQYEVILLDYPAYFEAGKGPVFSRVIDAILESKPTVVTCSSFEYYDSCVKNTYLSSGKKSDSSYPDPKIYFAEMDEAGIERIIEPDMSMYDVFLRYSRNNSRVLLLTGRFSTILSQIRASQQEISNGILVFAQDIYEYFDRSSLYLENHPQIRVNPISTSTDYLDVAIYVNVGDKVFTADGKPVYLAEKISTGAEGLVFKTNDPNTVAKVYHRGVMTPLRWMKLMRMTRLGLSGKGICWPSELLYNSNHEPVGFIMPRAEGTTLGSVFDGQDAMTDKFPEWDRSAVVMAAQQVFEKIVFLHLHGILIGDIQLKNAMIKNPEQVYLIDMDSVQLEDLPCPVGTEEFTPPELWDKSFQSFLRTPLHEDYSCGILAFAMIFCGQHPYNQRQGHETLREEIAAKAFPYDLSNLDNSAVPLGGYEMIWRALPEHFRKLLHGAFSEGRRYETITWYKEISSYLDDLRCHRLGDENSYSLFPYYARKQKDVTPKPGMKRSIKDAIIHNPDLEEGKESFSTASENGRILYNGRPIGSAFLNQEKMVDIEIQRNAGYRGSFEIEPQNSRGCDDSSDTQSQSSISSNSTPPKGKRTDRGSPHHKEVTFSRLSIILLIIIVLICVGFALFFSMYR